MEGWHFFHAMRMAGYSLEKFKKILGVEEDNCNFHDSVFDCSHCNKYDYTDNGYTYNYRMTEYEQLGLRCGCWDEYAESDKAIEEYTDDHSKAIEMKNAENLEKKGKLKHLERFIGGWVDGRGGYFNGKSTREGKPETVLIEYQKKFPKKKFIFSHDESGQFQSYFSIWEVVSKKKKAKPLTKAKSMK
jgi:hypothetical protein